MRSFRPVRQISFRILPAIEVGFLSHQRFFQVCKPAQKLSLPVGVRAREVWHGSHARAGNRGRITRVWCGFCRGGRQCRVGYEYVRERGSFPANHAQIFGGGRWDCCIVTVCGVGVFYLECLQKKRSHSVRHAFYSAFRIEKEKPLLTTVRSSVPRSSSQYCSTRSAFDIRPRLFTLRVRSLSQRSLACQSVLCVDCMLNPPTIDSLYRYTAYNARATTAMAPHPAHRLCSPS